MGQLQLVIVSSVALVQFVSLYVGKPNKNCVNCEVKVVTVYVLIYRTAKNNFLEIVRV